MSTPNPTAIDPEHVEAVAEAIHDHDQLTYPQPRRVSWKLAPEGERKIQRARARVAIDAMSALERMPVKGSREG